MNGKRIWTRIIDQYSLYYDENDYGGATSWKVNFFDGSTSQDVFAGLVAEAEDGPNLLPYTCMKCAP